jgi:hypothetical protein
VTALRFRTGRWSIQEIDDLQYVVRRDEGSIGGCIVKEARKNCQARGGDELAGVTKPRNVQLVDDHQHVNRIHRAIRIHVKSVHGVRPIQRSDQEQRGAIVGHDANESCILDSGALNPPGWIELDRVVGVGLDR